MLGHREDLMMAGQGKLKRSKEQAVFPYLLFMVLLALMFIPEYPVMGAANVIYSWRVGVGLRLVDIIILGLFAFWAVAYRQRGSIAIFPRHFGVSLYFLGFGWLLAFVYGWLGGGENLFFDWRSILLGVLIAWMVSDTFARTNRFDLLASWFLRAFTLWASYLLLAYALGGGVVMATLGGRTPTFDGPTLSIFNFAVALSLAILLGPRSDMKRLALITLCVSMPLVIIAFRRTYWGELLMVLPLVMLLRGHVRKLVPLIALLGLILGALFNGLGPSRVVDRVQSMNPFVTSSVAASTNEDHVNDILDAWDVVRNSPFFGLGLGRPYETTRIANWKSESWGVHNAILHVWVRYGLIGLFGYVLWHWRVLVGWWHAVKQNGEDGGSLQSIRTAALAWTFSSFVVSLFFTPWPYGSLQLMVLHGTLWGLLLLRRARLI